MYKTDLGICALNIGGKNAPWHFILFIATDSCYGRREFSSIIIILWKNRCWSRYWWKPGHMLSKGERYSRNKRLHRNANPHNASLTENKANNRCPDLDSGMKEGEEIANMQCDQWVNAFSACCEKKRDSASLSRGMSSAAERRSHTFF